MKGYIRLLFSYIVLHVFRRSLLKKDIWTIGEKKTEARDNGLHFFRYMLTQHSELPVYYIIVKNSSDEAKLPSDRILHYGSFKHCIYYLATKYRVGGQLHGNRPYYEIGKLEGKLIRKDQMRIFVGHGINKDNLDNVFDYKQSGYSLMTCGAKREFEYYKERYCIPDKYIALTGLCRYDKLFNEKRKNASKKQILIMPTFRSWLRVDDSTKETASIKESEMFKGSSYYATYMSLLNNKDLLDNCIKNDIKIVFYLHFTFQPYANLFENGLCEKAKKVVTVAKRTVYDVQTLLIESSFLITDYSSVFFDFAYMHKPVLYYQFDEKQYRDMQYQEGYFSYEKDGFGPIITDEQGIVAYCLMMIKHNFVVEKKYLDRSDSFFVLHDNKNCERVFQEIVKRRVERYEKLH